MDSESTGIAFMVYDNRSGSTYLAALLDSFREIGVTIESPILFHMIRKKTYRKVSDIAHIISHMYSDPKFMEWGIPQETMWNKLVSALPLSAGELIHLVLDAYFSQNKPQAKCWLYKGCNPFWIKRLKEALPGAKFLFVLRDGRAVFCSKRRSRNPYTGKLMEKNPIRAAKAWVDYIRIIDGLPFQEDILRVKYEELVENTEETIRAVHHFLLGQRLTNTVVARTGSSAYYARIPEAQSNLHANITAKPLRSRINAWKAEIGDAEGYLYEKTAGSLLIRSGYFTQYLNKKRSIREWQQILVLYGRTVLAQLIRLQKRLCYHIGHPIDAFWSFSYKLQTRCQKGNSRISSIKGRK